MYERILITFVLYFYSEDVRIKALLTLAIISIYSILVNLMKPYKKLAKNQLDLEGSNICALSIFFCIFAY